MPVLGSSRTGTRLGVKWYVSSCVYLKGLEGKTTSPILIYLQKHRTFDSIVGVAESPQPDVVRQLERFEEDGDFVRVRARAMGVQGKGFHDC